MLPGPLTLHLGVATAGRLPPVARTERVSVTEIAVLTLCGIGAALLSAYGQVPLRIPGHAIIRSVFLMALGLALVPRHGAGLCMGGAALATIMALRVTGLAQMGAGATVSLVVTGPFLDLAVLGAKSGWRLYLGLMLAGVATNLSALLVRGGVKELMPVTSAGRPFMEWLAQAALTYPLCGAIAGLISAVLWFRLQTRRHPREQAP